MLNIYFRLALQKERAEREKAEEMNKQLEEKAKSLEMSAREAAEGNLNIDDVVWYGMAWFGIVWCVVNVV